ncbi:putative RNA-directed DNA polymerase from transposon BS [Chionoecetes opilio]|uniref:Putative RNA-directed DNA polymerase from transposon BS n=1 Tax=Chionoecetes opilio TaxID=41210 RepID=A0A8J4Y5G5_CHIOP|nr:putative RNA-directed DNA polymerase from transposon BS [Chionoecetes opilio]
MDHRTPLAEVSRKIKIVQGKKASSPLHPDPTKKSNELMQEWADASSYDCLPLQVRSALATNAKNRIGKIEAALLDPNVSDNMPITEEELVGSLEKASSSAPGTDGVTYDGIRFLTTIDGNPVLRLYNMIWRGGRLPTPWKKAIIVPIPKPGNPGSLRPISLTSCLCKCFERIVLNRLLYSIKPQLSSNLYGFIPGRSTQHCIHRGLAGIRKRWNVFIDLKAAFDRADPSVILSQLSNMTSGTIIRIVQDYLTDRHSRGYFEGAYSRWEHRELGTPRGLFSPQRSSTHL